MLERLTRLWCFLYVFESRVASEEEKNFTFVSHPDFVLFLLHGREERAENILSKELDNKAEKAMKREESRMRKYPNSARCNL